MVRLLAMVGGLLGVALVPLALSATTAWLLLIPAYLTFVGVTSTGAFLDGFDGRPEHARRWGFFSLVATALMIGALEVGAQARGARMGYWWGPWLCALFSGWLPPVVGGVMGAAGVWRRRRLLRRVARARRAASDA